tara:strand:+ start:559 stop:1287 length:729 start_codon:yes stop_codon:yes gene_type:complete
MHGVILLAGGSGDRMGSDIEDKLLHPILETNAFRLCCTAYIGIKEISSLVIVYREKEQQKLLQNEFDISSKRFHGCLDPIYVAGGSRREDSVRKGLEALPEGCSFVQVHDCARPLIRHTTIIQMIKEVEDKGVIVACRPASDTIRQTLETGHPPDLPQKTQTLNRQSLWLMETPQATHKSWLTRALNRAKESNTLVTDEVSALELDDRKTAFFCLDYPNPKITNKDDLKLIEYLLNKERNIL